MSGEWVSARAVAWVIHDAPVPADLAWTLTVIAARCDEHGRGSYQATATIAEKTGKSSKQAQRDVVRLRELGLLLLGDQSLTEHLPPGQRPVVYDVPLHLSGPKPVKESKNKAGVKKPVTPPMDGTPPFQGTPPMKGESTPPMDVPGPLPSMGGKQPLNNPLNNPSLSGAERVVMDALADKGVTEEETREIISLMKDDALKKGRPIDNIGPFVRTVAANGDLPEHLARVRAAAERRAAYAARQAQLAQLDAEVPRPRGDAPPLDREQVTADLRARLLELNPRAAERPAATRAPATPPPPPNPEAEAARAELAARGDFDRWIATARDKLGDDAHRDEVVILAAELAHAERTP